MGVFSKIFGSTSKKVEVAGDVLVPVYLDSIALGAEPKTQVEKIRAIVGDSNQEFNGYLDELAMAGDEKPEVITKAVEIVKQYYKDNIAGDEAKKPDDKKPDDKGDEDKKPDDKGMRLSGDEIDAIAQKTASIIMAAQTQSKKENVSGDEQLPELNMPMGGDAGKDAVLTSDSLMKDIWG